MAKPYKSSDVKSLIKEHKCLISQLDECKNESEKAAGRIRSKMLMMVGRNVFGLHEKAEFIDGKDDSENKDIKTLCTDLYRQVSLLKIDANNQAVKNEYLNDINENISAASSMGNSFKWLFTSSKRKESSAQAVEYLRSLLEGSYQKRVMENHSMFEQLCSTGEDVLYEEFKKAPQKCESLCREYLKEKGYTVHSLSEVTKMADDVNRIQGRLDDINKEIFEQKTEIEKAVEGYRDREALKILKDVPVDVLSRDNSGVRVKLLQDAGHTKITDVISMSREKLMEINGIGEDNAAAIRNSVDRYLGEVRKTIKIKLSADDRSIESGRLLSSLYTYMYKKDVQLKSSQYVSDNLEKISEGSTNLLNAGDSVKWTFLPASKKNDIRNSYNELKGLLSDEYISGFEKTAVTSAAVSVNDVYADFSNNPVKYVNALEEVIPGSTGDDSSMYGLPRDLADNIRTQSFGLEGLGCTLRPYQEWGVKYVLHQEKVLLGDEMGLGKTIQALASITALRNTGETHFMVICPASVLANWCKEIQNKSDLTPVRIHGRDRLESLEKWKNEGGVAVTTYETTAFIKLEEGYEFSFLVVDEAHYIKNEGAQRSKNVKEISKHAKRMLFMTGTALENKVDEMISLVEILKPEVAKEIKNIAFMSSAQQFRDKVASVYYRRKREDVLTELPEKIENEEWTILLDDEKKIYEADVLAKKYSDIRRVSWKCDDLSKSSKAVRLKEIVEEAREEGRKIIVFSFFLDTIKKVRELLGDICMEPINGSVAPAKRQEIIEEFEKSPDGSVLCAQIQSGGTGLNIQCASVVILCEPQLKPSIENQAISRAYRMGQARNVLVYRLLSDDTVDEKIMDLLKQKQEIFDAFADDSTAAEQTEKSDIDETTFSNIIEEEIQRIKAKNGDTGDVQTEEKQIEEEIIPSETADAQNGENADVLHDNMN